MNGKMSLTASLSLATDIETPRAKKERQNKLCVMATGGGAYKFYDKIRDALGVEVHREDEMECLIVGQPLQPFLSNLGISGH